MKEDAILDPRNYKIVSKRGAASGLTTTQMTALQKLVQNQGDLTTLTPAVRKQLAGLQVRTATDPNIAGNAVIIDFSIRAVSIHKTWSWFKNFRSSGPFDPRVLPRVDLDLGAIVRRR
jgi:hypothetical protein